MIGPFLILLAIFLFIVAGKGKSYEFIQAMFPNLQGPFTTAENSIDKTVSDWFTNWYQNSVLTPFQTMLTDALKNIPGIGGLIGGGGGGGSSNSSTTIPGVTGSGGGGGNNLVGHYTVNLAGGGQMNVNANSASDAIQNVIAQGGTPAYG